MPAPCYKAWNSATGALNTSVPTGQLSSAAANTPRTMLQLAPSATTPIRVIEYGYTLFSTPTAPFQIELVDTDAVFASGLTAHVAAGLHKWNKPTGEASTLQLGTALTGYNVAGAATEGTITATREIEFHNETGLYLNKQYPLGRECEIAAGKCLRIKVTPTAALAITIAVYVVWEE